MYIKKKYNSRTINELLSRCKIPICRRLVQIGFVVDLYKSRIVVVDSFVDLPSACTNRELYSASTSRMSVLKLQEKIVFFPVPVPVSLSALGNTRAEKIAKVTLFSSLTFDYAQSAGLISRGRRPRL